MNPPARIHTKGDPRGDKRIVLMSRRALITLATVTLALLWILQPNRALLIDMLEDAQDPTVAIAFLNVLKSNQVPSLKLDLTLAKQHFKLDQYHQSLAQLTPLTKFADSALLTQAQTLYADSLLRLIQRQDPTARRQLIDYLNALVPELNSSQRQHFASYALQIGEPRLAYQLLSQQQGEHQALLSLALQAGLKERAIFHSQALYEQQPSDAHFEQLLGLYSAQQHWQQGEALIRRHQHQCDNTCLQLSINFLRAANKPTLAAQLSASKAKQSTDPADWRQASERFAEVGDIEQAAVWLAKVLSVAPTLADKRQLHDYYLWLGDTASALVLAKQIIATQPDKALLWQGVSEALAESDLFALSDFYYQLALKDELDDSTLKQWVDFSDKALGAQTTLTHLQTLHQRFPEREFYWFQLARFYNFVGAPKQATALWATLPLEPTYDYINLNYFAQSFVAIGDVYKALMLLYRYSDEEALDVEQLTNLQELATYIANRPLQQRFQRARVHRGDTSLDPYLLIATHNKLDQQSLDTLWLYYAQTKSIVVLNHLLEYGLSEQNAALIKRASDALTADHSGDKRLSVQLLRVRLAMYKKHHTRAKELLSTLLTQYPHNPNVQQSALWLAIDSQDTPWLRELYWYLAPHNQQTASMYQALAYAAQQLGEYTHADSWYRKLDNAKLSTAADKLAWASQLQNQGALAQAQRLRVQVLTQLSAELRALQDGEISYVSLLRTLVSPAYASAQLNWHLHQGNGGADINALFSDPTLGALQKIALLQAHQVIASEQFNDSILLSLALAQNNHSQARTLAYQSTALTATERATALSQLGDNFAAWQLGQQALNSGVAKQDLAPLQRFLAAQHDRHAHGVRFEHSLLDTWQLSTEQLSYYRPLGDGHMALSYQYDSGDPASTLIDHYQDQSVNLDWRIRARPRWQGLHFGIAISERDTNTVFGQHASATWQSDRRLSHTLSVRHSMPSQQSENLYMFGNEDRLAYQLSWQPTRYEQVNINISRALFHSDFGEPIGQQWQSSVRLSEQFNFTPSWQVYAQYDHQENTLDERPLQRLTAHLQRPELVRAVDFLTPKYRRLALGQSLLRGEVSQPGRNTPGMRYWLDTAVGYNFIEQRVDYSANVGLGVQAFGNDEFFIKGVWQSADQNGRESLTLNVGYFIDF
ncbi:tetratricopeptide repeat protein [Pseudoalteromonas sp. CO325X]|uniref:tetratricopeptide repeat protein n=1 Tax=Pseudoalteromonas sp. CO325X TaxID=1777262 RepID=UPI0010233EFF|nr:tetratricopeptide repeat protein [Pseudoalteromonas sp. CO325X]RZF83056.1 tetratricopeptide repeat protein [Pseudoalteromonas sp. CO325X]